MSKQANPKLIGGFVVGAVALVVLGVMVFGSGKFLTKKMRYVLYFEESVKGLNVGAPVDFKGVRVGSVGDIKIVLNRWDRSLSIPVYIDIDPHKVTAVHLDLKSGEPPLELGRGVLVEQMIRDGWKAQLAMQSMVTGLLGVHLDFYPEKPIRLVGADPNTPELPTVQSSLSELSKTIEKIPIEEIAGKLLLTIDGLEKLVNAPEVKDILSNADKTVKELRELAANLNVKIGPLADDAGGALREARKLFQNLDENVKPVASNMAVAFKDADALIRDLEARLPKLVSSLEETLKTARASLHQADKAMDGVAGHNSAVRYELVKALTELAAAARSIRVMADYLERRPEALIRGKGK